MGKKLLPLAVVIVLIATACRTTDHRLPTAVDVPKELLGSFIDDYGSSYLIRSNVWRHGPSIKYDLLMYNSDGQYFIAQNDDANPSDGGLFTRIDIMYFNDMEPWRWGFCLTAYKAASIQDAINTVSADRSNPRKGCNGFPFTRMKRE